METLLSWDIMIYNRKREGCSTDFEMFREGGFRNEDHVYSPQFISGGNGPGGVSVRLF
ncbi:hypothetical protein F220043C3_01880 [Enterocloster asparagiformis]